MVFTLIVTQSVDSRHFALDHPPIGFLMHQPRNSITVAYVYHCWISQLFSLRYTNAEKVLATLEVQTLRKEYTATSALTYLL